MKMYKGKHNDDLFSLIDNNDNFGESNSLNSFQNHGALTPEEVLEVLELPHFRNQKKSQKV